MKATDIRTGQDYALKRLGQEPVWCRAVAVKAILNVEEGEDSPKGTAVKLADGEVILVPNREILDRWSDHLTKTDLRDEYLESAKRERRQGRLERGERATTVEGHLRARGVPVQPRPVSAHDSDDRETVAIDLAELGFNVYLDESGQIPWVLTATSETTRVITDGMPFVFTSHQMVWLLTTAPATA